MTHRVNATAGDAGLMLPTSLRISSSEVHVWVAALDRPSGTVARLAATLSEDETSRAARFLRCRDRERFIVARGTLRAILSVYLDRPPEVLRFVYGLHGKPALAPVQDPALTFNVAHSGSLALYGIARGRRIGVDVEKVRTDYDYAAIARRFFTSEESAAVWSLPVETRSWAFYRIWTSKEAYVKARGERLFTGLEGVVVACAPGQPPSLLMVPGGSGEVALWDLRVVDPAPGYVGALVAEGHDWSLIWHREAL